MKTYEVEGIGTVNVNKRRGAKRLVARVKNGQVHVTIPPSASYRQAINFVSKKQAWLQQQLDESQHKDVENGDLFLDKQIVIESETSRQNLRIEETAAEVVVYTPNVDINDDKLQANIKKQLRNLLKRKSEAEISKLVEALADEHQLEYQSVNFQDLKSRWGSCDSKKQIKFSIYLVQLPTELQEYVVAHELAHTVYLNHSADFKSLLEKMIPDYRERRKVLKKYQTDLILL